MTICGSLGIKGISATILRVVKAVCAKAALCQRSIAGAAYNPDDSAVGNRAAVQSIYPSPMLP